MTRGKLHAGSARRWRCHINGIQLSSSFVSDRHVSFGDFQSNCNILLYRHLLFRCTCIWIGIPATFWRHIRPTDRPRRRHTIFLDRKANNNNIITNLLPLTLSSALSHLYIHISPYYSLSHSTTRGTEDAESKRNRSLIAINYANRRGEWRVEGERQPGELSWVTHASQVSCC